jgi:lipopolysaccharide/colanic/teichoic acid biosynthesis glycosyltransferase
MYKHFFKRLIDIIFSAIAIVLLAIPMCIIA